MPSINSRPRWTRYVAALALVVVAPVALASCGTKEVRGPQGLVGTYNGPCHFTEGGTGFTAESGCTITFESGSTVTGAVANDLNGGNFVIDATGNTALRATQDNLPILTLGGTPTAAAFTVNDSAGTPAAVIRGNGELSALRILKAATAAPIAGVASTEIAPTGLIQPVSMATAGTVPITIPGAGSIVCIYNTGSEVVTIADSGNQVLSASGAMGQYDVICGISDGTRFIEFARSNN